MGPTNFYMYYKSPSGIKQKYSIVICIALLTLLVRYNGYAQSLGDPIVNITFGAGTGQFAGSLPADSGSTTYTYINGTPSDGLYTIANSTNGMYTGWWRTSDHTGNPGGYMMIVNCDYAPGIFYTRKVKGLCGNTKYQFAAWIKNLLNYVGKPSNIKFSIETTNGVLLGSDSTGIIPLKDEWKQYPFTFSTPAGIDSIVIKMNNIAPGGNGNDVAIDDITFRPYGDPVAVVFDKATTQSICAGSPKTININPTTTLSTGYALKLQQMINGVWTDQGTPFTNSAASFLSPTAAGTYSYRVVSALAGNIAAAQCVVSSNILTLTVAPLPDTTFTAPAKTCLGDSTFFTAPAEPSGTIWLWNFGDGGTSAKQNPAHLYSSPGDYTVMLTVTNASGCPLTGTKKIHIAKLPTAKFTYSSPDCETRAVIFTDLSAPNEGIITKWVWDYGDGSLPDIRTDNIKPFQHTYTPGSYTVKLSVTNTNGCLSTATQSFIVSPLPVVDFILPAACVSDKVTFIDNSKISDNSESSFTYLWNFGDAANATPANPNTSNLKNPTHKYNTASTYPVSLTITSNNNCAVTTTKTFIVNGATPVANFAVLNPNTLCSNREVYFINNSSVDFGNATRIDWYFDMINNPTVVVTDNSPYPGKQYRHTYPEFHSPASIDYTVRMVVYSGAICFSPKLDQVITLRATPHLTFSTQLPLCQNNAPVQLSVLEDSGIQGGGIYLGTGVNTTGLFDPAVSGSGTFPIKYIYTASTTGACADTVSQNIVVNPYPQINAGSDITILAGGASQLHATTTSNGNLTYSWSPASGLSSTSIPNPIASPAINTTYTLTATNSNGCSATSKVNVVVLQAPTVPNAFTPNGDSINDVWKILYLDTYSGCTIEVFNRSGKKVFSSIGYPIPWDGRFNGADLPVGVYYYIINPKHGRSMISGSVTIIR